MIPKGEMPSLWVERETLPTPSLPAAHGASTDPVSHGWTSTALFREAGHPPRAGTALGAGKDSVPLQLEGSRSAQSEMPHHFWAALSPKHSQRSRGEQQGRKAALHTNPEQLPSPSGLTRVPQTSASSW